MVLAVVPFVYPFVFIALTALKPADEFRTNKLGVPHSLTLAHLRSAWHRADLGSALLNSAVVCTLGVAVLLVTTSLGAYWFLRNQNRMGRILLIVFIGAWALPVVTWIVPLFVLLSQLGQTNNLIVLGFAYGALNAPFGLYLFYTFFREGVPPEIIEAGEVDGASTFQQFRSIVLPVERSRHRDRRCTRLRLDLGGAAACGVAHPNPRQLDCARLPPRPSRRSVHRIRRGRPQRR